MQNIGIMNENIEAEDVKDGTSTSQLIESSMGDSVNNLNLFSPMQGYERIVKLRKDKLSNSNLRFATQDFMSKKGPRNSRLLNNLCCKKKAKDCLNEKLFSEMNEYERQERIKYLWYRVKVIASAQIFIVVVQANIASGDLQRMKKFNLQVVYEDESSLKMMDTKKVRPEHALHTIWYCIISCFIWFNLVSSPFLILWPELNKDKYLNKILWVNELIWTLDIFRKFLVKPEKSRETDTYEIAVAYIKSTLIIDLIATLPQVTSFLKERFIPFKILRLFNYLWALHYPYEAFVHGC